MYLFSGLLIVVIAIVFRLANLDGLVYWGDEVYSSLRILGYTTAQMAQTIAQGDLVSAATLQQFQQLSPQLGLAATIGGLMREDSHLTPLYFILGRLWVTEFGTAVGAIRGFSVFCSLLLLPCLYWLAMVLFERRRVAVCVVVLTIVSPMQLIFAQEARMYELWLLLTVLSQAALLDALRQPTWRRWGLYTIATIAAIYSHLLGAVPFAFNALYILVIYWRDRAVGKRFVLSAGLVIAAVLPWLWVFWHRQIVKQADGTDGPSSPMIALQNWSSLFRRLFADFNLSSSHSVSSAIGLTLITLFCLLLVGLGLRALYRETDRHVWLFVGLLIVAMPIGLLPMTVRGLLPSRYVLPSYIGLELAVGYLFGTRLADPKPWRQGGRQGWGWSLVLAFLIGLGLVSCGLIVRSEDWWSKGFSECNPAAARVINQTPKPLVITDGTGAPFFDHALSNAISLGLLVQPATQFQIVLEPQLPQLAEGFSDRFVLTPSAHLRQWLAQQYPGKLLPLLSLRHSYRDSNTCLWRLRD
jgi:uncharacterized membrane protein